MGNRLTRIYTRTGDSGTTGLADGSRRDKDDLRIEAIGAVDELNTALGLLLCADLPETISRAAGRLQHRLFDLGGELALPGAEVITEAAVQQLETALDELNAELPPLRDFVLPGGNEAAARCHLARSICRRAERALLSLHRAEPLNPDSLRFLNRLSDLLFVMSRTLARRDGGTEVIWQRDGEP